MIKYRLVGTYPNSPCLGSYVGEDMVLYDSNMNRLDRELSPLEVIYLGDVRFWEKCFLSDFLITKVSYNGEFFDRFDGTFFYQVGYSIESDITSRVHIEDIMKCDIISLVRLSDMVSFSIGDLTNFGVLNSINMGFDGILINSKIVDISELVKKSVQVIKK